MPESPSFTDGRRALKDPTLENLNVLIAGLPLALHYISDTLAEGGRSISHELEGEGDHLGSDTKASGAKSGSINFQKNKATDAATRPGHILKLTKAAAEYYVVQPAAPDPGNRNDVTRPSVNVIQVVNPFFRGLLSETEGDTFRQTVSKAGGDATIDPLPVNHRTGATKTYSAVLSDGSALPTGVAINTSTGVITVTAATVSEAVLTILVRALDQVTGKLDREAEATLVLTVTA